VIAPQHVKFFFWLALHERLGLLSHGHNIDCKMMTVAPSVTNTHTEMLDHLLAGCIFTRYVWHIILEPVNLAALVPKVSDILIE
jgi:hypothetical protein